MIYINDATVDDKQADNGVMIQVEAGSSGMSYSEIVNVW